MKRATGRTAQSGGFGASVKKAAAKAEPRKRPPPPKAAPKPKAKPKGPKAPTAAAKRAAAELAKRAAERAAELERKLQLARAAAEAQRKAAAKAKRSRPVDERWFEALDRIQTYTGGTLRVARPPTSPVYQWERLTRPGTPWAIRGVYDFGGRSMSYLQLGEALQGVSRDRTINRSIGPNRLTRIQVTYRGPAKRNGRRMVEHEWTLAEIAPWDATIDRAIERLVGALDDESDEPDADALHVKYPDTVCLRMIVWISDMEAESVPF